MTQSVPVWFGELHVGDVTVGEDGSLGFDYTDRWRATKSAFPLSVTLPLQAGPFDSEAISPWLANLLPEERQLKVLTRVYGLDHADTLALLSEIGGDTAGALSFGEPSERRSSITPATARASMHELLPWNWARLRQAAGADPAVQAV